MEKGGRSNHLRTGTGKFLPGEAGKALAGNRNPRGWGKVGKLTQQQASPAENYPFHVKASQGQKVAKDPKE